MISAPDTIRNLYLTSGAPEGLRNQRLQSPAPHMGAHTHTHGPGRRPHRYRTAFNHPSTLGPGVSRRARGPERSTRCSQPARPRRLCKQAGGLLLHPARRWCQRGAQGLKPRLPVARSSARPPARPARGPRALHTGVKQVTAERPLFPAGSTTCGSEHTSRVTLVGEAPPRLETALQTRAREER